MRRSPWSFHNTMVLRLSQHHAKAYLPPDETLPDNICGKRSDISVYTSGIYTARQYDCETTGRDGRATTAIIARSRV
jgi:hypothetical protein